MYVCRMFVDTENLFHIFDFPGFNDETSGFDERIFEILKEHHRM